MQRFFSYGSFLLVLMAVVIMPGCGGGSDSTPTPPDNTITAIDTNPVTLSMEFGQVLVLSAVARNAAGETVIQSFTFKSDNTALVNVSPGGNVCAGTWDATFIVCTPGTTAGATTITVTAGGTSKAVPVNIHRRIASVTVTTTGVACTSSTKTQAFTAKAFASDGTEITSTVGTPNWLSTNVEVATLDTAGLATAKKPGASNIIAVINNVVSLPVSMVTCPPASITIKEKDIDPAVTSFTLETGTFKTLAAVVVDTLGFTITDITLTYSTSQQAVATVTTSGVITAVNPGRAGIVASCSPPTCNPGLNTAVFSNLVTVAVNGTSASTVYVTGKNAASIIPIDTATNTAGTAIAIPTVTVDGATVNPVVSSMVFTPDGSIGYVGTDRGMLALSAVGNTLTNPVAAAGTVLAIAHNNSRVLIANATAGAVYVVDPFSSPAYATQTLTVPNATAAAFSPDSSKAYIVSGSTIYVYSLAAPLRQLTVSSAVNDATVLTQGNYAYFAGDVGATIAARATCNDAALTALATAQKPLLLKSTYDSTHVFGTDGTNMYDVSVTSTAAPCPPPAPAHSLTTTSYGVTVTPRQLILLPDGTKTYLTNNSPQLLVYGPGAGATVLNLAAGSTASTTGGVTLDGKSLYVGALGANNVQKFDTATGLVTAITIDLKDRAGVATTPDFVAVRPK
ncbi:MAG: hypothetical protein ABIP12_06845 [Terriglobales bacterium]